MSQRTDVMDVDFYRAHYPDVGMMSKAALRRHYDRHGKSEGRWPNAELFLRDVEAREGPPPPDFDWATYLTLNPDLASSHSSRWQATAHFLSYGWREKRPYVNGQDPADTVRSSRFPRVTRSVLERLRTTLHVALGEGLDDELVGEVHLAQRAAAGSGGAAAALMDPILIARHRLMHPHGGFDFSRSDVQLGALFRVAFSAEGARGSRPAERDVLNRIRAAALATSVAASADPRLPPVTLLMMAAWTTLSDHPVEAPREDEVFRALARFFVIHVPRLELERFVTPQQRALLRAAYRDGPPLAAWMLDEAAPQPRDALSRPGDRTTAFWSEDVWRAGLAYVMSGDQLQAAQLRIETWGEDDRVLGPPFILPAPGGADPTWAEREATETWLQALVLERLQTEPSPHLLVGPSVVSHVACGGRMPAPSRFASPGRGRKPLRSGAPVSLAGDGGAQHLVGPGWSHAETQGRWTTAVGASIAITLDEADTGPLDLFITLAPGSRTGRTISLSWNGGPVAVLRPDREGFTTVNCYLGSSHRSGVATNILGVNVDRTFVPDADPRRLGVLVRDFMLVRR